MYQKPTQEMIDDYLRNAKRIAIVGLSANEERTSFQIAKILQEEGYQIIPVNPLLAGKTILGERAYANLLEVPGKVDIVNIFRRSEYLSEVAREFVQINADVFWAQLGIESEEATVILLNDKREKIVMNRCIKIELRRQKKKLKNGFPVFSFFY